MPTDPNETAASSNAGVLTQEATNNTCIKVPEPPFSDQYDKKLEIMKLKMNIIKWTLGTFVISLLTFITTWNFNDRAKGMTELDAYSRYTTDLIVLNSNPAKKRMLAQFFAKASPSPWLRWCWGTYYEEVNKDFNEYEKRKKDSVKLVKFLDDKIVKGDSSALSTSQKRQLKEASAYLKRVNNEEKSPIVVRPISTAADLEKKGFESLLAKNKESAIINFSNCEAIFPGYHNAYDISLYLKTLKDPVDWKEVYKKIVNDYSWKIPDDILKQFKENAK